MVLFVTIALVGLLILVLSALSGAGHMDHDHDFHGLETHADHGVHHGETSQPDQHAPSPFSMRVISLFLVGFGAMGAIGDRRGWGYMVSSVAGILAGLGVGLSGWQFIKLLLRQQGSSTVSSEDLVGKTGKVITAIPFSGIGEISVVVKGQLLHFMAREIGGDAIEAGLEVFVVESGDEVLTVHLT